MLLPSASALVFIGDMSSSLHENSPTKPPRQLHRKPRFRSFLGENTTKMGRCRMYFCAWLHLIRPSGDISSESSFELRILKYFAFLDNLGNKLSINPNSNWISPPLSLI